MPESQNVELARAALLEMTTEASIGDLLVERVEEDGSITVAFASALGGYPGWAWTVSLAHVDGLEPTVLEAELIPGDGALLAPDWVPWADRLADYKAAQEAAEAEAAAGEVAQSGEGSGDDLDDDDSDDDDDDDDELDDEDTDDDLLGSDVLHGGDLDGVDIDDLDDSDDDDSDDDSDDESDDDSDENERSY